MTAFANRASIWRRWARPLLVVLALIGFVAVAGHVAMDEAWAQTTPPPADPAKPAEPAKPPEAAKKPATLNSGDTAWMLTATALVLLMTLPGVALFYGGMVRKKNVLSVFMHVFAISCIASIVWVVAGYSLALKGAGAYIGDLSALFLQGISAATLTPEFDSANAIPETVFIVFQMTFAIITPALIVGAYVDRMKFSAMVLFVILWSLLVYSPVAHWVWAAGAGWLNVRGALDFAGGTVVHINAGVAGLVAAYMLGKRTGFGTENMAPHNLTLAVIGASMLWVGWFGFNAGSALTAGTGAGMAMLVTHIASAAAALTWMFIEWMARGKASVLGIISGAIAGLVGITPAAGYVGVLGALVIGCAAGLVCYWAVTVLKKMLGADDALDVFGVHGVGGIVGAILTGVFATKVVTGSADPVGWIDGKGSQVVHQVVGVLATVIWCAVVTAVILLVIKVLVGLRVSPEKEREGLDLAEHGESIH